MTSGTPTSDGGRLALKPAQETALAALESGAAADLTRASYEEITGVSRSQAAYDLADLVTLGLVERLGAGRATRYRLARGAGGRPRKWTDERIRAALEAFCAELGRWPRAIEFREAGHGDLYLAASRYGGIDYWAAELGERTSADGGSAAARGAPADGHPRAAVVTASARGAGLDLTLGRILLAGAILVLVVTFAALVLLADRSPRSAATPAVLPATDRPVDAAPTAGAALADTPRKRPDGRITLRLSAVSAPSWLSVRLGSADGRRLFKGTLTTGRSLRFRGERLWIRLGAPAGLRARVGRRAVPLPARTSTMLVGKRGVRVLDIAPRARPPAEVPVVVSEPVVVEYTPPSAEPAEPSPATSPPPPPPEDESPSPDPRPAPDPDPDPQRP